MLIDGGIFNNVPVNIVRDMGADVVLAMDVELDRTLMKSGIRSASSLNWPLPTPEAFQDFYHSCLLMISKITEFNFMQSNPDILLNPQIPLEISEFFGFNKAREVIELGRQAAQKAIPQIMGMLSKQDS